MGLLLTEIQKKQFSDKRGAETDLLHFLQEHEDGTIQKVELQPKPESLNSLNGFVTFENGERFFFKTHTEENEKVSEYYNAAELANAGYPIITSKQVSHRVGKQIVLYQIISYPTLFDLLKIQEDKFIAETNSAGSVGSAGNVGSADTPSHSIAERLLQGQIDLDKLVAAVYSQHLARATAEEQANAVINQLFSHRLEEDGRVGLFYRNRTLHLESRSIPFEELSRFQWNINGVQYSQTLNEIIERSKDSLRPRAGATVPGHGDAHNGNIFVDLEGPKFYMFDPAFAGKHHPILDLTKPLFHNVFARWMYYPDQVLNEFSIDYSLRENAIHIQHNYAPSKLRLAHLKSRVDNVLRPTIAMLKENGMLDNDWKEVLRAALFCCPFLTVNLLANYVPNGTLSERYKPAIKLLGLSMAMEFGATTRTGSNQLTEIIDEVLAQ